MLMNERQRTADIFSFSVEEFDPQDTVARNVVEQVASHVHARQLSEI
jgi:hypothetical protein